MIQENFRQPLKHFFIKKQIQLNLILKIFFIVIISAVVITVFLTILYNIKAQEGSFYYMSNDLEEDLELKNILEFILPIVIGTQIFSILVGLGIGLFFSRKVAIPIYKFEKWVSQLKNGNLNIKLSFREPENMEDLTLLCNDMAENYRKIFKELEASVNSLEKACSTNASSIEHIENIKKILQKVNYK